MRTPYSLIYSTHNGDDAPQNLIFEYFSKTCQENSSFINIRQE